MIINCENCEVETYKRPCHVKKNKNLFCGQECHDDFRRKIQYADLTEKVGMDFKEWLEKKYWGEELSARHISKILYGKSTNSPNVLTWLKKNNIPIRDRSDAVALQWKDNYERREKQGETFGEALKGKASPKRRDLKSIKTEYAALNFTVTKRIFVNGYTYLYCECKNCGYEVTKALGNKNGCVQCSLKSRTFADQTTVRAQRSKLRPWRKAVLERDNYACKTCGGKEDLVAHHIECFARNEALRFEVYNGVTLCEFCHREFHNYYGYGDNNLLQFSQFEQMKVST